ncbi:MAG: hypothetical protein ACKVI4_16425, partial [Actinomycetales bacterium]
DTTALRVSTGQVCRCFALMADLVDPTGEYVKNLTAYVFHRGEIVEGVESASTLNPDDTIKLVAQVWSSLNAQCGAAVRAFVDPLSDTNKARFAMAILAAEFTQLTDITPFVYPTDGAVPADGALTIGADTDFEMFLAMFAAGRLRAALLGVQGLSNLAEPATVVPPAGVGGNVHAAGNDVTAMMDLQASRTKEGRQDIELLKAMDPAAVQKLTADGGNKELLGSMIAASDGLAPKAAATYALEQSTELLQRASDSDAQLKSLQKAVIIGGVTGCDPVSSQIVSLHNALRRFLRAGMGKGISYTNTRASKIVELATDKFMRYDVTLWHGNADDVSLSRGTTVLGGYQPLEIRSEADVINFVSSILGWYAAMGEATSVDHGGVDVHELIMRRVSFLYKSANVHDYSKIMKNYVFVVFATFNSMMSCKTHGWLRHAVARPKLSRLLKHLSLDDVEIDTDAQFDEEEREAISQVIDAYNTTKNMGGQNEGLTSVNKDMAAMSSKIDSLKSEINKVNAVKRTISFEGALSQKQPPQPKPQVYAQQPYYQQQTNPNPFNPYYPPREDVPPPGFVPPGVGQQPMLMPPPPPHGSGPGLIRDQRGRKPTQQPVLPDCVTNIDKDAIAAWRKLHSGGPGEWTKNNDRVRCFYADTARVIKYAGWAALCPNDCMFGHAGVKGKNGIVRKPVDHKVHLKFLQDHNVPFSPPM